MKIDEYERLMGPIHVDVDTRFCMEWLERCGYKFCLEFGWENAKDLAVREAKRRIGTL